MFEGILQKMTRGLVESYKGYTAATKIIVLQVKRNFDLHHRIRVKQKKLSFVFNYA